MVQWRFRWQQWRALPPELRLRKLWQHIGVFGGRRRDDGNRELLQHTAAARLLPFLTLPPRERLLPFRDGLRYWWMQAQRGAVQLFPPCWTPLPLHRQPQAGQGGGSPYTPQEPTHFALLAEPQQIDWQCDMLSGHRWDESAELLPRQLSRSLVADPKGAWELGRLQFLLPLGVLAYVEGEPVASAVWSWCRRVITDFVTHNPLGYGVQWRSPLEVAVRAMALVTVCELFRACGAWEAHVERLVLQSLAEHGLFLMQNLEWNAGLRGNHYMGNVVGLLILGAVIDGIPLGDTWLAFGIQELEREALVQFLPDGGHWEGSVYYHRFVLEMALLGTAAVLALPEERRRALRRYDARLWRGERALRPAPLQEVPVPNSALCAPFSEEYWQRLQAAVRFAAAVTKPNGRAPQIGDHDNGRWLKLVPRMYLLTPADMAASVAPPGCSVTELAEDVRQYRPTLGLAAVLCRQCPPEWRQEPESSLFPQVPVLEVGEPAAVEVFPDFGLVVYRWGKLFLAVRCGGLDRLHPSGGHAHCDQLSIELALGTDDVIVDPGTYCYTASPQWRNRFRSTAWHSTLVVDRTEQFRFFGHSAEALFWLFRQGTSARILQAKEQEFLGEFVHPRYRHRRYLQLVPNALLGVDTYEGSVAAVLHFHLAPEVVVERASEDELLWRVSAGTLRFSASVPAECADSVVSPGYGVQLRSCLVRLAVPQSGAVHWRIELLP